MANENSEIVVEQTGYGFRVRLPASAKVKDYLACRYKIDPPGLMVLISESKDRGTTFTYPYVKQGDKWIAFKREGIPEWLASRYDGLPKYGPETPEHRAFEALLKKSSQPPAKT